MKSVTDLDEGSRLAEILPKGTADFHYARIIMCSEELVPYNEQFKLYHGANNSVLPSIPAWSLTALCNAIKVTEKTDFELYKDGYDVFNYSKDEWFACYENTSFEDVHDYVFINKHSTEIIDAVVELIVELKEKNLL